MVNPRLDQDTAEGEASISLNVDAALYLSINVAGYNWKMYCTNNRSTLTSVNPSILSLSQTTAVPH